MVMEGLIPQFGVKPNGIFRDRPSAYAVVFNDDGNILVLRVGATHHLPGGGVVPGENPHATVQREALEEAGVSIHDIRYLGRANQYMRKTKEGPLNKLSTFFRARAVGSTDVKGIEKDHKALWMTPGAFCDSTAGNFQKWAVRKSLGDDYSNGT